MADTIINAAKEYITKLFSGNYGGHDAAHSLRVYENALLIAKSIPECDICIVSLAALLHDADDYKLFKTENNANTRIFLEQQGMDGEMTERICRTINSVSFSQNRSRRPDTAEGQIVQDADRLDALGAIGIARTFAYGGEHGRPLESSVRHFYDKLLLLKDEMNTEAAKRIAESRLEFLEAFLRELHKETHS